jgi:hypothetical protein
MMLSNSNVDELSGRLRLAGPSLRHLGVPTENVLVDRTNAPPKDGRLYGEVSVSD